MFQVAWPNSAQYFDVVSESAPVTSKPFGRPSGLCAPW